MARRLRWCVRETIVRGTRSWHARCLARRGHLSKGDESARWTFTEIAIVKPSTCCYDSRMNKLENANARWSGILSLLSLSVAVAGCMGEEPLPSDLESAGESQSAIRGLDINNSYWAAMGRNARTDEVSYWSAQPDYSIPSVLGWHGDWLAGTGWPDRKKMIEESYITIFARTPTTAEMSAWESNVIQHHYLFQDVIRIHRAWANANGMTPSGTCCTTAFVGSAFQTECGPFYGLSP
jgi:hypothetical protein